MMQLIDIERKTGSRFWDVVFTIIPIALYVFVLVAAGVFATSNAQGGNIALGFLFLLGVPVSFYAFVRVCNVHESRSWPGVFSVWVFGILTLIGVLHFIGGLFVTDAETQQAFVYTSLWVTLFALTVFAAKFLMDGAKAHRRNQV